VFEKITVRHAKAGYLNLEGYENLPDDSVYWDEDILNHRHLVSAINGFFERGDFARFAGSELFEPYIVGHLSKISLAGFKMPEEPSDSEILCLISAQKSERAQTALKVLPKDCKNTQHINIPGNDIREEPKIYVYPYFGLFIYRSKGVYLALRCGPVGQNGNGGHAHNDQLSIDFNVDGMDWIVDPGTYLYTADPEWRNKFRSTAFHNTVVIDGKEQNPFDPENLFSIQNNAATKIHNWEVRNELDTFIGEHYGYQRFINPVIHQRQLEFNKKEEKLRIIDKFIGKGEHDVEWNLVLSPWLSQDLEIYSDQLSWSKATAFYSPQYGAKQKTIKYTARLREEMPFQTELDVTIGRNDGQ